MNKMESTEAPQKSTLIPAPHLVGSEEEIWGSQLNVDVGTRQEGRSRCRLQ